MCISLTSVTVQVVVGDDRTAEEWNFLSGGEAEMRFSDDVGRFVKTVTVDISNTGDGTVSEDMVLDITRLATDRDEIMNNTPDDLASWGCHYNIIDVSGTVIG